MTEADRCRALAEADLGEAAADQDDRAACAALDIVDLDSASLEEAADRWIAPLRASGLPVVKDRCRSNCPACSNRRVSPAEETAGCATASVAVGCGACGPLGDCIYLVVLLVSA
jgi:hypothetical protein